MAVSWPGDVLTIRFGGKQVVIPAATRALRDGETNRVAAERVQSEVRAQLPDRAIFFSDDRTRVRVAPKGHVPDANWQDRGPHITEFFDDDTGAGT